MEIREATAGTRRSGAWDPPAFVALASAIAWIPPMITGDRWKYLVPFADAAWSIGAIGLPSAAVAVGRWSRRRIDETDRRGRRIAVAGLALGWIELAGIAAVVLFSVVAGAVYLIRVLTSGPG
jgi:hypothetical protein